MAGRSRSTQLPDACGRVLEQLGAVESCDREVGHAGEVLQGSVAIAAREPGLGAYLEHARERGPLFIQSEQSIRRGARLLVPRRLHEHVEPRVGRLDGVLRLEDPRTAAIDFVMLCHGELVLRAQLGILQYPADREVRETVRRAVDEGLVRSTDDRVVCATAANVFLVRGGELLTPRISDCGVAGVMREVVLRLAQVLGIHAEIGDYTLDDLARADECFLTNAVRGIRPVGCIVGVNDFRPGELTARLRDAVETADE